MQGSFFRFRSAGRFAVPRFSARLSRLTLGAAIFLVLFENDSFWRALSEAVGGVSTANLPFLCSVFVFLVVAINLGLTLLCYRHTTKVVLVAILLGSVVAGYFMNRYGTMIDKTMIQNVFETDTAEAMGLMSASLVGTFLVLGLLPSLLLLRTEVAYGSFRSEALSKLKVVAASLAVIGLIAVFFYKDYAIVGRNHRYLRHLINPVNYVYAVSCNVKRVLDNGKIEIRPIGEDAARVAAGGREKKNLVVLVVGETARAANFSLDGYGRQTNPLLEKEDIVNFENASSCGTATATSLPCMFSEFDRSSYSDAKGKGYENLLDVLSRTGVHVLWRDNNSGCKGVCDRVESEGVSAAQVEGLCESGECYDMVLLQDLQDYVDRLDDDALIVLHQKGSHGPTYNLREPEEFKVFQPECGTNQLRECSDEEIVNAYDNTIVYTDYFLSQVISFLKANSEKSDTAMIYVSDHGESLGENNLYLHGLPYFIAPEEQKHVPFLVWMSEGFGRDNGIDEEVLRREEDREISHDNLFHSVLGLMDVKTKLYDARLDIFAPARNHG